MVKRAWDNLSEEEWENICDRCGKCCLVSLQDIDSGEIYHTNILCQYYDIENKLCSVYDKRCQLVPNCLKLNKNNVDKLPFMPKTCAYRALFDKNYRKQPLKSLQGRVVSQQDVDENDLENYIVDWDDI
jgi:hypothetical protein